MKTSFYLFICFLYFRPNLCSVQRENYRRGRRLYTQWRYTRSTSSTVGPRASWPCSQVHLIIRSSGRLTFPTSPKQYRWDGKFELDILNCLWINDVEYFQSNLLGVPAELGNIPFVIMIKRAVFNIHNQST